MRSLSDSATVVIRRQGCNEVQAAGDPGPLNVVRPRGIPNSDSIPGFGSDDILR
jgi:hypothetical protein